MKNINSFFSSKSLGGDVEVDESSRIVRGYLASFNNKDESKDILVKGCFAKSIKEHGPQSNATRRIVHLWQHDNTTPLGKYLKLEEDDQGLYFEALFDDIPKAHDVLAQYKSGTLNQHSIGFWYIPDKVDYDEKDDSYFIKEVTLIEGSTVTFGCNENTPFLGFGSKGLQDFSSEASLKSLEKEVLNTLKGLPHEQQIILRKQFSTYQALVSTQPIKSLPSNEPLKDKKKSLNDLFK